MDVNAYGKRFLELVGIEPTDEFLKRVEAAEAAGMPDALMLDCLAYEAKPAAALAGIYTRSCGEERGRRKACAVVYRRMRQCWKMRK